MLLHASISALFLQAYGVYAVFWMEEFGWSRTTIALAYSLHRTESGLLGPLHGWLLKRYSPRRVIGVGVVLLGGGFIALSQIQDFTQFLIAFLVMAIGASLAGILSLMTVIVNWFDRRRALALSMITTGLSIGGLLVPLVAAGIVTFGWRAVAAGSGVFVVLLGLPLARLMHKDPESRGLKPDGDDTSSATARHTQVPSMSTRSALATKEFWLMSMGHAAAIAVVSAYLVHIVIVANEVLGLPPTTGAAILTLTTVFALGGQVAGGVLGDTVERSALAGAAMVGHAAAMVLIAIAPSVWMFVAGACIHGAAWGVRGPLMAAIRVDHFGRASFSQIMGISSLLVMSGAVGGPIVVATLADATGSYGMGFGTLSAIALAGAFGFFALPPTSATRSVFAPRLPSSEQQQTEAIEDAFRKHQPVEPPERTSSKE
jgi:MFS family permease